MEILLASLLLLWGNASAGNPDMTFEQMVQASMNYKAAVAQQQTPSNGSGGEEGRPDGNQSDALKQDPQEDAPAIKGIYSTANSAGGARLEKLLKLIDDTELNAMVIDIKEDRGYITYKTDNPELLKLGTTQNYIGDINILMDTLEEHEVYPIARIVVFKDTVLAKKRPDLSFLKADGTLLTNNKKEPESFVNPYKKEVWDYNIEIAKEAVKIGFKEIQFDYVRFPEGFEKKADSVEYFKDDRTRVDVVAEFVKYAREQLNPLGVRVSVDIFGFAASVPAAEGIGQDFEKISRDADVICPMIYPSHYSTGWFDSKVPDAAPYVTINGAMVDTHKKLEPLGDIKPIIRPWIQDFTATWVIGHIPYGKKEVELQIKALKDNGVNEYLLWNSSNIYTPDVEYK